MRRGSFARAEAVTCSQYGIRRVCPSRDRTTKPLASRVAAGFATAARSVSVPGTVTVLAVTSDTPAADLDRLIETFQTPAPPPASVSRVRRLEERPRRTRPNERLAGLAKTSGWSARGSQI